MIGRELGGAIAASARRLVDRLESMSDTEYLWEPVTGCWTLRRASDGAWKADLGPDGNTWTPISPPPVTTIAWRMWHLGASPNPSWPPTSARSARAFAVDWFDQPSGGSATGLGTSLDAIDALSRHWAAFSASVESFDDEEVLWPIGEIGGPFGESSILGLIVHVLDELIHHSAEIALLRDLFSAGFSSNQQ